MNAPMRTVRLMDRRPGEPKDEVKEVMGIRIDRDIPLPPRLIGKIDAALMALEIGESFEHTKRIGTRKKLAGKKFTIRRQPNGKYRVWRTK